MGLLQKNDLTLRENINIIENFYHPFAEILFRNRDFLEGLLLANFFEFLDPQVPYRDSIMWVLVMSGRFRPPQKK